MRSLCSQLLGSRRVLFGSALLLLFSVSACDGDAASGGGCATNAECASGLCISGQCRAVGGADVIATAFCSADGDCAYGWRCVAGQCERPTGCTTDADCTDGDGGHCQAGGCRYDTSPPGCANDADCPDGVCDLVTGACVAADPCAGGCDDGDPCTQDGCGRTGCTHAPIAGCCATAADCDDGDPETTEECRDGHCVEVTTACATTADCDDGHLCTHDACIGSVCEHTAIPGCCEAAVDCDDGDACTNDSCVDNTCHYEAAADCCMTSADCSDGDPCTADECGASHRCSNRAIPDCCTSPADCDDHDPCTRDNCPDGACTHDAVDGCCRTLADCDDSDPCTQDACSENLCTWTPVAECCAEDADCDDGVTITVDSCVAHACVHEERQDCTADADCDDGNLCTIDTCNMATGVCSHGVNGDPACQCEVEADCDTRGGGVCTLVDGGADGIQLYCSEPEGALSMGSSCDPETPQTCESGLCLEVNGSPICYGACASDNDCAGATHCGTVSLPGDAGAPVNEFPVCAPDPIHCVDDASCADDMYCRPYTEGDPPTGVIFGCFSVAGSLGRVGEPCTSDEGCETGYCLADEDRGGICYGVCDDDFDCQVGQRCYPGLVSLAGFDIPSCQWDIGSLDPCVSETACAVGEVCFPFLNADDTAFAPSCRVAYDATDTIPGAPCNENADCQTAVCVSGANQKLCLSFCEASYQCTLGTCESVTFTLTNDDGTTTDMDADVCVD